MTTPEPDPPADTPVGAARRPPVLLLVLAGWLVAAGLVLTGSVLNLYQSRTTPNDAATRLDGYSSGESYSMAFTGWSEQITRTENGDQVSTEQARSPRFGVPLVAGAAGLLAGALLAAGALLGGAVRVWRWSVAVAGLSTAVLVGSAWTLWTFVWTLLGEQDSADYYHNDDRPGTGLWLLTTGIVLAAAALAAALRAGRGAGPVLRPPRKEPPTPAFGLPVIRPVGYDG